MRQRDADGGKGPLAGINNSDELKAWLRKQLPEGVIAKQKGVHSLIAHKFFQICSIFKN
jgi:hypothetical protein